MLKLQVLPGLSQQARVLKSREKYSTEDHLLPKSYILLEFQASMELLRKEVALLLGALLAALSARNDTTKNH